jgi:hypothetical protein
MTKYRKARTSGFGELSKVEQRELRKLLAKANMDFTEVDNGKELVLVKISATGLIPDIITFLTGHGIDLHDL